MTKQQTRNLISLTCRQTLSSRIIAAAVTNIKTIGTTLGGRSSTNNLGKTAGLDNDSFYNTGAHDIAMFHCSVKQIANYIQLNYGNEISEAICTMTPMVIDISEIPKDKQDPDDCTTIIQGHQH